MIQRRPIYTGYIFPSVHTPKKKKKNVYLMKFMDYILVSRQWTLTSLWNRETEQPGWRRPPPDQRFRRCENRRTSGEAHIGGSWRQFSMTEGLYATQSWPEAVCLAIHSALTYKQGRCIGFNCFYASYLKTINFISRKFSIMLHMILFECSG